MNIIPLHQQPSSCPVCGHGKSNAKACGMVCVRTGLRYFTEATTHGDKLQPHSHVSCAECGFEFLVACVEPDVVERLL